MTLCFSHPYAPFRGYIENQIMKFAPDITGACCYRPVTGSMLAWAKVDQNRYRNDRVDSYIIRIYRRDIDSPETMVGVLEAASDGVQQSFHSRDELWNSLAEAQLRDKKTKKKTSKASGLRPE